MEAMDWLVIIIVAQLFYSSAITGMVYSTPADDLDYVTSFRDLADQINPTMVSQRIQQNVQSQTNVPIVEVGALVFYTGNLVIDLLLNFAFATPQMIVLLINGITRLVAIDPYMTGIIQAFITAIVGILYFVGMIRLFMNIRSGVKFT